MLECSDVLRAKGKLYPRTCAVHGLGPCRNSNGVPNRPKAAVVITIQSDNPEYAKDWAEYIRSEQSVLTALPIAIVTVEDWSE